MTWLWNYVGHCNKDFISSLLESWDHDTDYLVILGPLMFLPFFLRIYQYILIRNETLAQKAIIQDPVLNALPTYDTSLIITASSLLSTAVFIHTIVTTVPHTELARTTAHLLCVFYIISLMRMICIILCPLKQHTAGILLRDHFIQCIAGKSMSTRHDLMFSGHMAQQVFYLYYAPQHKVLFLVMSIQSAMMLLLGKIHYTIDIIVAWCLTNYICGLFPLSEYKISDG